MTLTGHLLLFIVLTFTLMTMAAVVVLWPRLSSPGPLPLLGRIGALLAVVVLTVLSSAVVLNDQFLFYVDWSDLLSLGGQNSTSSISLAGAPVASVFGAPQGGELASDPNFPLPAAPQFFPALPGMSTIDPGVYAFVVQGSQSGLSGQVLVVTPQGYDASGATTYPVLIFPPTYPGSPEGTLKSSEIIKVTTSLEKQGRLAPSIIVLPTTSFPSARDSECVNWPSGPAAETWMSVDVPTWLSQNFPVIHNRDAWATLGVSAGGYCAASTAMLHSDVFSAAISLGGYFTPQFSGSPPFSASSPLGEQYDLIRGAGHRPPSIAVWVQTTKQDTESGPSTLAFIAAARPPLAVQAVVEQTGGHRWSIWRPVIEPALLWLGAVSPGFHLP
jgi:S-formylglutathione hydrolase FrmB